MEITAQELEQLNKEEYQLIDIRSEVEKAHGAITGAVCIPAEGLEESTLLCKDKKVILCCSRGKFSLDAAERLRELGYDAYSLTGGYIAWLLYHMQQEEENEFNRNVEQSIRKKFHKNIWSRFAKAIQQYRLEIYRYGPWI